MYYDSSTTLLLELVHSDLCGPLEVPSLGGSPYFMTIIDDFSRYTTVYLLKRKSEAFQYFQLFYKKVENILDRKLKSLRTDNGGEYISSEFCKYRNINGIVHQTTIPYTPQQNGVAERMNRTLLNHARAMLQSKNLNKSFWAEALQTSVYIRNRIPCSALPNNITPHHLWHKSTPDLSHIRVFGCKCFYVVPKPQVQKLDARSRKAIFLGYLSDSKGYKLWDDDTMKIIASRDVTFLEIETKQCSEETEPEDTSIQIPHHFVCKMLKSRIEGETMKADSRTQINRLRRNPKAPPMIKMITLLNT